MRRITIACPAAHTDDANSLAMVLGYGPADGLTYSNVGYQDAGGNLYACASLPVGDSFVSTATSPLVRPEWDVDEIIDMAAANRAQALVTIWGLGEDEGDPAVTPDHILAMFNPDPLSILARAGVERIESLA